MTEIMDFCQDDLDEDDVMLLDTWEEVSRPFAKGTTEPQFGPLNTSGCIKYGT